MTASKQLSEAIRQWSEIFMRHSGRDFRLFMSHASVSFSQIGVLMRLYHRGQCSLSDLGDDMGVTLPAASQSIDKLVKNGLIERREDPQDRRLKQIGLTEKGGCLVRDAIEARSRWIEDLSASLSEAEQEQVIRGLNLLNEAVGRMEN